MIRKILFAALLASFLLSSMIGCGVNGDTQTDSHLVGISITPAQFSIANNSVEQFTATGLYSDNTTRDLTSSVIWSSTDTSVATFDGATGSLSLAAAVGTAKPGRAYAKAVGKTTITASLGGLSGTTTLNVTSATLVSVAITPVNPSIAKGTTLLFTATGTYSDHTTQDVTALATWASSNASVATMSNASGSNGLATSTAAGTTTITATSGGLSASTTLTVTPATLVSLAVTPTAATIAKGTNQQFAATGTYSDGTTQDLTAAATWDSSNSGVATISNTSGSNGLATSAAAGSTTITATAGIVTGSTTLTVTPATLVAVTVTPANPSIAKGTTQQFTATGRYSDSTTQDITSAATWSVSATTVATISNAAGSKGLAISAGVGSTTITAASGNISGSTTLTVTPATLTAVTVTPANPSIAKGTIQQLTAIGTYSDNTTQDLTATATWSSSASAVASISNAAGSKGLATTVAAGTTTIAATLGSLSGSTMLTVTPSTLLSLAVTPTTATVAKGANQQFAATGTYSDGTTQDLTATATWSSSASAVASISNAAGSKGLATAVAAGSATMTAGSGGVSGSAVLTVTAVLSATLTWDAPTTRTDGTPLNPATDVFKYRIYYGTASASYSQAIDVMNPGTTPVQYTASLPSGTYYFVVTTIDMFGQESSYSNEVSKTL